MIGEAMAFLDKHKAIETHATLLAGAELPGGDHRRDGADRAAVLPGEHHRGGEGVRPYSPAGTGGRDIYIREGCYVCHSQMIRPMRDEVERYGHYSLAAESMYDHPFQWGSKRTGPDLARVGGAIRTPGMSDH
jgi:cytochrome c oxidase cbb3-type subunit II